MFKRVLAACLAVILLLLTFGCGKDSTADPEPVVKDAPKFEGKIAIVVGDQSQSPEAYAAASEIAGVYPDSVMLLKYAENFYSNPNAVTTVAAAAAENQNVKAILFADGVKGTGAAVRAVREARDDVCIVVCNPHEGTVEMKGADLMLSVDFPALGQAMVQKAKEMGAENFVFYMTLRHMQYSSVAALRRALELACEDEEMTFKAKTCIDRYDSGKSLDHSKLFLAEDAPRIQSAFGQKTALVCTEPQIQGALAAQVIERGTVMPATFLPSPLSLAADLGVDMSGHETDSKYALEQLRAESVGASGVVATWEFSSYVAFLHAAFDYAVSVVNGDDTKTTVANVQRLLEKYTAGAAVSVSTDANFAYLVQSDLVTL